MNIFYGKNDEKNIKINLSHNERFIKLFNDSIDIVMIEILRNDNIPNDKL